MREAAGKLRPIVPEGAGAAIQLPLPFVDFFQAPIQFVVAFFNVRFPFVDVPSLVRQRFIQPRVAPVLEAVAKFLSVSGIQRFVLFAVNGEILQIVEEKMHFRNGGILKSQGRDVADAVDLVAIGRGALVRFVQENRTRGKAHHFIGITFHHGRGVFVEKILFFFKDHGVPDLVGAFQGGIQENLIRFTGQAAFL